MTPAKMLAKRYYKLNLGFNWSMFRRIYLPYYLEIMSLQEGANAISPLEQCNTGFNRPANYEFLPGTGTVGFIAGSKYNCC
jgi:hypothetical protein